MLPHFNRISSATPCSFIIKSGLSHCYFVYFFLMVTVDLSNIIKTLLSQFILHTTFKKIIDLLKDNDFWIDGTDVEFPNCVPKVDIIVCLLVTDKRTDVWSRDFIIWKINSGLWAVVWAGLGWAGLGCDIKRVWAVYEQLLMLVF